MPLFRNFPNGKLNADVDSVAKSGELRVDETKDVFLLFTSNSPRSNSPSGRAEGVEYTEYQVWHFGIR